MLVGSMPVVDEEGYRANVGIIVVNHKRRLLWAKRIGQDAWQFPQGGIHDDETPEQALYRELHEELGLQAEDVELLGCTRGWLRYRLPKHLIRYHSKPLCIGQKQKWFLLRLVGGVDKIHFDVTSSPEFDGWRWVSYWFPLRQVISFKRQVYRRALQELAPLVFTESRIKPDRQPHQGQS